MRPERVMLRFAGNADDKVTSGRSRYVELRELCGHDELAVDGINTAAAIRLIERLFKDSDNINTSALKVDVNQLCASDRDSLLAALHRQRWGDHIISSLLCRSCDSAFDLSFDLSALQRDIYKQARQIQSALSPGPSPAPPTAEQELAAIDYGRQGAVFLAAVSRGICNDISTQELEQLSEQLEAIAPLIDVDLQARCPECGHEQTARFDLQSYVMQRLLNEREQLLQELHSMALHYGWGLAEILSLPTSTRRAIAERLS